MDKGSRIILVSLLIAIAGSVGVTYWSTMHAGNFIIIDDVEEEEIAEEHEGAAPEGDGNVEEESL